jgi:predicted dehydrogenase
MADAAVRIGMIGTGPRGQVHLRHLAQIPEARLVALCDLDEEVLQSVAAPLGAATYTDGAKMIDEAELDALYICVPPHQHDDLEIRAAQKGLHLFVEKPVSLYMEQAQRTLDAIRSAGVLSQVGYQGRYMANYQQMKAFLEDKQIGTAHATRWGSMPAKDWWRRYDQGGGQLVEMTTHQVDLMRWVMGEVEAVSAGYSFSRLLKDQTGVTVPDSQTVLLHFASGATATINTACAVGRAGRMDVAFVVDGAWVSLQNDGIKLEPEDAYPIPPLRTDLPDINAVFVRAVATQDRTLLRSPYEDGLKTAAVTLAANLSAENGGRLIRMTELLGKL